MFSKHFDINSEIIQIRTGKTIQEYFVQLINYIKESVLNNTILEGIIELLSDQQKNSVRSTLERDILLGLKSRLAA
jgi:hypothetical protein